MYHADDATASTRRKAAFLVSLWLEPSASAEAQWRGSVEHLASGRRLYFNQIAALIGFLSDWLRDSSRS